MKITAVEPLLVPPGWLFVRIQTEDGITGWGEAGASAHHVPVAAAVSELAEFLVGSSARQIEHHWQTMRRVGFFRGGAVASSAAAAIDCALWDIAGRRAGAPVHELVGGPVSDCIRAFALVSDAEQARARAAEGYTAFTLVLESDSEATLVPLVEAVRSAIGAQAELAVDCRGQLSLASARNLLALLEPHRLLTVCEPIRRAPPHVLADLAARSSVSLSVGRSLYSRWDIEPVLATGLASIDLDVATACGISETRRMAALAETHKIRSTLSSNRGPVALAASLQVAFSTANVAGHAWDSASTDAHREYLSSPLGQIVDGCYTRPRGDGLGVTINEAVVVKTASRALRRTSPAVRSRPA